MGTLKYDSTVKLVEYGLSIQAILSNFIHSSRGSISHNQKGRKYYLLCLLQVIIQIWRVFIKNNSQKFLRILQYTYVVINLIFRIDK